MERSVPSSKPSKTPADRRESKACMGSLSGDEIGSLERLDSLDEYFLINSPPDSPQVQRQSYQQDPQQNQPPSYPEYYGYYAGHSSNNATTSIQGNAKMSTSNISVDRSNSVGNARHARSNSIGAGRVFHDVDELLKQSDEKDFNLSELFLKSTERRSLNRTYETAGALTGHDKELHRTRSHSLSSVQYESDVASDATNQNDNRQPKNDNSGNAKSGPNEEDCFDGTGELDLDVEPTPLAEIRRKAQGRKRMREQSNGYGDVLQQQSSTQSGLIQQRKRERSSADSSTAATQPSAQQMQEQQSYQRRQEQQQQQLHVSSYYPYGRSYQLPIPQMPLPAGTSTASTASGNKPIAPGPAAGAAETPNSFEAALATAAAIACHQNDGPTTGNLQVPKHMPTPPRSPAVQSSGHSRTNHSSPARSPAPNASSPGPGQPTQQSQHHQPMQHSHSQQQQQQQQQYPYHQYAHNAHHPTNLGYPIAAHSLTTPLAAGTSMPRVVGPYTTAQQKSTLPASGGSIRAMQGKALQSGTSSSSTSTTNAKPAPALQDVASYLPRRGTHTTREAAAAHTTPKGALTEAAKQRRGYSGFHKAPTSQTTNRHHHSILPQKTTYSGIPSSIDTTVQAKTMSPSSAMDQKVPSHVPSRSGSRGGLPQHAAYPPITGSSSHGNPETAYERKKQRAKDARVKLNESIEKLHVAMSLAGTESKQRSAQLAQVFEGSGRSFDGIGQHVFHDASKTAETAKKWDRPNFVGSAATLIQCLNSQCDVLTKELIESRRNNPGSERPGRPPPPPISLQTNANGVASRPAIEEPKNPEENPYQSASQHGTIVANGETLIGGENSSEPNPKAQNTTVDDSIKATFQPKKGVILTVDAAIMRKISLYLDPLSLVRCRSVSTNWRDINCFAGEDAWLNLCVKRFGSFNVRQWQAQHQEEEEDNDEKGMTNRGSSSIGPALYRSMDSANVTPHFQHEGGGSLLLLGSTKLSSNVVSAWTFVVERSNGETLRSVKRSPADDGSPRGTGMYTSIPIVEVRTVIQNTGGCSSSNLPVVMKEQLFSVDAATRRRGEEMPEIHWDERFRHQVLNLDGSVHSSAESSETDSRKELARLQLFDAVVLVTYIHAHRCSTITKFIQRSNFMKVLVSVNGTTEPLVVPFTNLKKTRQANSTS